MNLHISWEKFVLSNIKLFRKMCCTFARATLEIFQDTIHCIKTICIVCIVYQIYVPNVMSSSKHRTCSMLLRDAFSVRWFACLLSRSKVSEQRAKKSRQNIDTMPIVNFLRLSPSENWAQWPLNAMLLCFHMFALHEKR